MIWPKGILSRGRKQQIINHLHCSMTLIKMYPCTFKKLLLIVVMMSTMMMIMNGDDDDDDDEDIFKSQCFRLNE